MKISANILLYTNLEIFSSLYPSILRLTINDTNGITNADIPKRSFTSLLENFAPIPPIKFCVLSSIGLNELLETILSSVCQSSRYEINAIIDIIENNARKVPKFFLFLLLAKDFKILPIFLSFIYFKNTNEMYTHRNYIYRFYKLIVNNC